MNIEGIPAKLLSLGASFISGFILAAWCLPAFTNKPRTDNTKPGAILVIPARDFASPAKLADLKGKSVRLIRKSFLEKSDDCIINHKPAQLQIGDQNVYLDFGMDGLESLVLNVSPSDLKQPDVIDISKSGSQANCSSHPRVTYGS